MAGTIFPQIFTFYSFKGGVGRSMALMNVAYTLAGWGRHVLILDMDLEAPGISGFQHRSGELDASGARATSDILTLVSDVMRISKEVGAPKELAKQLPAVSHYLCAVKREKLKALAPKMGRLGRLDVIGVDTEHKYAARLAQLGLGGRAQSELVAISRILHHYLKAQVFADGPAGLDDPELEFPAHYDYVLVDSRTGINEIAGLCIGPLADRLVIVTGLNDQNVQGTMQFLEEIGLDVPGASVECELDDERPEFGVLGPKPTIIVASPVPNGEMEYRAKRLGELERVLGVRPIRLSYHARVALMETVFVRDFRDEYLAEEYRRLAGHVLTLADDSFESLANRAHALVEKGEDAQEAIRLVGRMAPQAPENAAVLLATLGRGFADDVQVWALLAQWKPMRAHALYNWANALVEEARSKAGEEAADLFAKAYGKFGEAAGLNPGMTEAWGNWGGALASEARAKAGEEADGLYAKAYAKHEEAVRLQPERAESWNRWGADLGEQAKTKKGEAADGLFAEAYAKFEEALRLNPGMADAWAGWATALGNQAETKTGDAKTWLYNQAHSKRAEAVRLNPELADAPSAWGGFRDMTQYFAWMEAECAFIELKAFRLSSGRAGRCPIDALYVEPLSRGRGEELPLGEAVAGGKSCVIAGDAGSGKSTFLKKLAWNYCRSKERFPILIRISEFDRFLAESPEEPDDARWVARYLGQRGWGLDEAYFDEMLGRADTLLLLDGLDEAADEKRRGRMTGVFEAARRRYGRCQIVVSTRPWAYEGTPLLSGFEVVEIADLGPAQIAEFVSKWTALTGQTELERALERPEIRRMARNPLMLTAIAVVQWNGKVLPEQRAALYDSIVTWLAKARMERLPWEKRLGMMGTLALRMQSYPGGHRVSLGRGDAANLLAGDFENVAEASRFLLTEEIDSGIITSSGNEVRYWHRTFQEYLAAWRLSGFTDDLLWEGAAPYLYVREWREVMLLLAGCLCEAKGHGRLDLFLGKVLGTAGDSLAEKARCVALVAGMMNDLRAAKYEMPAAEAARYEALKRELQSIFTVGGAAGISVKVRAEAAEALPRLYLPGDERYWVELDGGSFWMGAQKTDQNGRNYDPEAFDGETVREAAVRPFLMGRYPVTVFEFERFLWANADWTIPEKWEDQLLSPGRPVAGVQWRDAVAYCQWIGGRLPSEEEWEFAARGAEGRKYPWGAEAPNEWRANFGGSGVGSPSPVGMFPAGDSPEGVSDLAGNVWEWTMSDYSEDRKIVRGGTYWSEAWHVRGAFREANLPAVGSHGIGFRCVRELWLPDYGNRREMGY